MTHKDVEKSLKALSSVKRRKANEWFFKTGKGEYGEGDKFVGVSMPNIRAVAKGSVELSFTEIRKLVSSEIHEFRMAGLIILTYQFKVADEKQRKRIYDFYLKNRKHINNWDLVDVTTPRIVGAYLLSQKKAERKILYTYAESKNMWERRIAILATFAFIYENDFKDALKISKILLKDKEDLLHKASGWMLREVGKRDLEALEKFLKQHYKKMPRTMLRYSIEKFPEKKRKAYLKGTI